MSNAKVPGDLKYTKEHEWTKKTGSGTVQVGITDFAQGSLGDVVYVELPELGTEFAQGGTFGVIESVKAASDLYSPCSGTVARINESLKDTPEMVNQDPYGNAWMIELEGVKDEELDSLMSADEYLKFIESL